MPRAHHMNPYEGPDRRKHVRRAWRGTTLGLVIGRLWSLIAYSDTAPTRFMLAFAATMWAVLLALPGDTFSRPVYRFMATVAGDNAEAKWCLLWTIHAVGMWWRLFSDHDSPLLSFLIHMLGVGLFTTAAISIFVTLTYPVPAAIAPDVAFAFAAGWVLVRTHVNSARGWRRD